MIQAATLARTPPRPADDAPHLLLVDDDRRIRDLLSRFLCGEGYQRFKAEQQTAELGGLAQRHGLDAAALQTFVVTILLRMIFDGEQLGDLMAPLGLGWKARTQKELALMDELTPLLRKRAQGRDISGLNAYEQ